MEIQWTIIKPEKETGFLWRYLSYEKLDDLLKTSELYLRRVDKFIDQYEAKLDESTSDKISYLFWEFPNSEQMQSELRNILTSFRKASFVNCWHLNNSEDIQMWRKYCGDSEGIVIKTTIDNLIESILPHDFGPMHFRPVTYGNRDLTNVDLRFPLELLNFKEEHFKFEKEYRISLVYIKNEKPPDEIKEFEEIIINPSEEGLKLKVNLHHLIQDLIISPFANSEFKQKIHKLCKCYLNLDPIESRILC